jgi:hypothetical protein
MSISHTSFQAELEGAILQQTASVDLYLQTHAPKWSPECYDRDDADDEGCAGLRSLFLSDLSCVAWQQQPYASSSSSNAGMEQQQDGWTLEHTRKRRPRQQALEVGGFVGIACLCLKAGIVAAASTLLPDRLAAAPSACCSPHTLWSVHLYLPLAVFV